MKVVVHVEGDPTPHASTINRAELVIRVLKDGTLEVIKSSYPEVPLGKYKRG